MTPQSGSAKNNDQTPDSDIDSVEIQRRMAKWTRTMSLATIILAIGTVILAFFTIRLAVDSSDQVEITRKTLNEQRHYDSLQISSDSIRQWRDSVLVVRQDTFSRATLDSTGIQIGISKETMQKQLRAYVYLAGGTAITGLTNDTFWTTYNARNSGQTPAYGVTIWCRKEFKPFQGHILQGMTTGIEKGITLNPGNSYQITPRVILDSTEEDSVLRMLAGIYTWGEIRYRDEFHAIHVTHFQLRSELRDDPHIETADTTGNESD